MKGEALSRFGARGDELSESLFPSSPQILLEVQGVEEHHIHLSHRKRSLLAELPPQQASRTGHRVFGRILAEVLERSQSTLAELNLVENEQRAPWDYGKTRKSLERRDQPLRVERSLEQLGRARTLGEINVDEVIEAPSTEALKRIGFPNLPCAEEQQGLALRRHLPLLQAGIDYSFHHSS